MEYISDGKVIKKNMHKNDRSISWIKLANDEWLIVALNYSEPLLEKAIKLLKHKGINLKQPAGKLVSYRYVCTMYIASKNDTINEKDRQYIEKIIKKNEIMSKVE